MPPLQRDRPLNNAECARLGAVLSRFGSEYAMNNLEEIDGFFAALICSPDVAKPSEYLPEIWGGGEMADDEALPDQQTTRVSPVRRALSVASRPGRASNRPEALRFSP